jgi:hypothetical protein
LQGRIGCLSIPINAGVLRIKSGSHREIARKKAGNPKPSLYLLSGETGVPVETFNDKEFEW